MGRNCIVASVAKSGSNGRRNIRIQKERRWHLQSCSGDVWELTNDLFW